jgi:hypothetical protein
LTLAGGHASLNGMAHAGHHRMSFAEYLAIEAESPIKHEFLLGQVWAMAGGSRRHGAIAANILRVLGNQLQAGPCQAHSSDVRIRFAPPAWQPTPMAASSVDGQSSIPRTTAGSPSPTRSF